MRCGKGTATATAPSNRSKSANAPKHGTPPTWRRPRAVAVLPVAACRVGVAPTVLGCRGGWCWCCDGLAWLSYQPETVRAHEHDQPQRPRLRRPGTAGGARSRRTAGQDGAGWTRPDALWALLGHQPLRRRRRRPGTGGGARSQTLASPSWRECAGDEGRAPTADRPATECAPAVARTKLERGLASRWLAMYLCEFKGRSSDGRIVGCGLRRGATDVR